MGDIADDHYAELYWSEGVGVGGDGGYGPPIDHPAYGGMDAYIYRRTLRPVSPYTCKFCSGKIAFIQRKPYNYADGSPHRCLTDNHPRQTSRVVTSNQSDLF